MMMVFQRMLWDTGKRELWLCMTVLLCVNICVNVIRVFLLVQTKHFKWENYMRYVITNTCKLIKKIGNHTI